MRDNQNSSITAERIGEKTRNDNSLKVFFKDWYYFIGINTSALFVK